jgi:2-octaprenyl-6-methoxyphenol hydroxylase
MALADVAIVGAGPAGAALAALLAGRDLAVELFEARSAPAADARTLALSYGSRELLEEARAWPQGTTAITSIHISQRGGAGRTVLEAGDARLPALGYTVSYAALEAALVERLRAAGTPIHYGESCNGIALDEEGAHLRFASGRQAHARLLVLADGGANASRIPGVAFQEKDYGQSAVVAAVHADRPHGGRAYERFTPEGPMALLPVDERHGLVWTAAPGEAARLLALDDAAFLAELQARFGDRAGRFTRVAQRGAFVLRLRAVNTPIAPHTAIIGNAAQVLHPIAGQGLNLGLRDVATLAALVGATPRESLGDAALLDRYREARQRDAGRGIAFTDALVSLFADARRMPTWGRAIALAALDALPPARRWLADRMIYGAPAP